MRTAGINRFVGAAALLLLSACAMQPAYRWSPAGPASERVEWRVVPPEALLSHCGPSQVRGWVTTVACAVQVRESSTCYVFSYLSEEQASVTYDLDGLAIRDHEMRHCQGWRH